MSIFFSFLRIVDRHTVVVTIATLAATYLCISAGYAIELPDGLIAIAVVFPLGFAISAAFGRRERALDAYATLKGRAAALYFAHRDWTSQPGGRLDDVSRVTVDLFEAVHRFLAGTGPDPDRLAPVYANFSRLSRCNEDLRTAGLSTSEIARVNEYAHEMIEQFERIRNISRYRTPASLRAYAKTFLNLLPLLFAPHFAYLATLHSPPVGFLVAAVYSVILVSLDNIQDALENPFDSLGEDDIVLDAIDNYRLLAKADGSPSMLGSLAIVGAGASPERSRTKGR